ncbi:hypothetical protein [Noviherbaspirillum denitrificans]|uniref:Uncharacterized protein n=1 Tax=Noviherbaspirillum denitrificans TaxID=1968433 RepID=A0A254T6V6_9BURK|nr:hypothetical protein [Noviherbaspirillum denitrificans]OWW18371.1 hypothetical protein AYR66_01250 [Noviherbaspirillum denitrificans]
MTNLLQQRGEDQFQSLLDTVERLRRDKFPTLDAGLVREILRLHADSAAGDGELTRGVEQAVEHYLNKGI